jgi:hypothetical protein
MRVDVAAYGAGRRERAEALQHLRAADVAGIEDEVRAGEGSDRLRPQQAVGIGDHADQGLHAGSASPCAIARYGA